MFFISRVDRLIIEIDALGQKVVSLISADTWQNETPPGKSKSNRREKAA